MKEETIRFIWGSLIAIVFIMGFYGLFWTMNISSPNIDFKITIEMDDNTREWLEKHDYCMSYIQNKYDSIEPTTLFMGDCKYLNSTILRTTLVYNFQEQDVQRIG